MQIIAFLAISADIISRCFQIKLLHTLVPDLMVRRYKSQVRTHLENCSPAWRPHYRKDKLLFDDLKKLEYNETPETEMRRENTVQT